MTSSTSSTITNEQIVYVDGSCLGQGIGKKWRAGYSAWFGVNDPRNVSEPIAGDKHTNNVGEMMAVITALERSEPERDLLIVSDSKYVINGLVGEPGKVPWHQTWQQNGWMTSDRKPVKNRDLWERMISIAKKRKFKMKWQKGHAKSRGNNIADKSAKLGASKAKAQIK